MFDAGNTHRGVAWLPPAAPELFIAAGTRLADRATQLGAPGSTVEDILRRAVVQAAVLRGVNRAV